MIERKKNITFQITTEGSLGLLALGAVGIKAWREHIKKEKPSMNTKTHGNQKD